MFFFKRKYHELFLFRLGLKKKKHIQCDLWVHGVSLGEVKLAQRFIETYRENYPQKKIALSCSTEAGMEEAKKRESLVDSLFFLPLDFDSLMKDTAEKIAPTQMVFIEGDLWPHLLYYLKKQGVFVSVINAKMSYRSFQRYKKLSFFGKWVFSFIDFIGAQNSEYEKLFKEFASCPVKATGNMKFDLNQPKKEKAYLTNTSTWKICIGSTHEGEEERLIEVLSPLLELYPLLQIAIVPRHSYRFDKVKDLFKKRGLSFDLHSQNPEFTNRWMIVDQMGVLLKIYEVCDIAIVGGSFVDIGGHNILEPLSYGKPTFFGPYMSLQKQIADESLKAGLATQVSLENLASHLKQYFEEPTRLYTEQEKILSFFKKNQGATKRNLEEMKNLFLF